jgi:hypothetical protein
MVGAVPPFSMHSITSVLGEQARWRCGPDRHRRIYELQGRPADAAALRTAGAD